MKDIILYYFEKFFINIKEYSTINYSFFLATLILLSGCLTEKNQDAKNDYYTIDYEQCVEKEQQMLLSEIADSVEYLELKTPEDIIINYITNIMTFNEDLLICASESLSKSKGVYHFRRNGQYVRTIGSIGRDFGEYEYANDFQIEKENQEIIIQDIGNIHFYNFEGKYLRSIQSSGYKIGLSDTILWINNLTSIDKKYIATAIDLNENGDTVAAISNPFYETKTNISTSINYASSFPPFYHKNGLLYLKPNQSYDTLWQISGTNKELYAVLNMGKYKLPIEYEYWYSVVDFERSSHKYWSIDITTEDDRRFFLKSGTRNPLKQHKEKYIVYDKKNKKGFTAKDKNDLKITDDIIGGPNVWPLWITEKYYISTINRDELQKQIDTGNYSPSEPLKSQLSRIEENFNQIIILCHRKGAS